MVTMSPQEIALALEDLEVARRSQAAVGIVLASIVHMMADQIRAEGKRHRAGNRKAKKPKVKKAG
jgi:uncharacterized metal-binding protein